MAQTGASARGTDRALPARGAVSPWTGSREGLSHGLSTPGDSKNLSVAVSWRLEGTEQGWGRTLTAGGVCWLPEGSTFPVQDGLGGESGAPRVSPGWGRGQPG